jgi:hypothetical protein
MIKSCTKICLLHVKHVDFLVGEGNFATISLDEKACNRLQQKLEKRFVLSFLRIGTV